MYPIYNSHTVCLIGLLRITEANFNARTLEGKKPEILFTKIMKLPGDTLKLIPPEIKPSTGDTKYLRVA